MIKKLYRYITRSWRDEPIRPTHTGIKIIPPFLFEIIGYLMLIVVVVALLKHFLR